MFEPIVLFFELTNSSEIFQTMINEILQSLINTGKVASFINNIIVRMKEEKKHNKIVKKVVKRLTENDLYVKLEKYK